MFIIASNSMPITFQKTVLHKFQSFHIFPDIAAVNYIHLSVSISPVLRFTVAYMMPLVKQFESADWLNTKADWLN